MWGIDGIDNLRPQEIICPPSLFFTNTVLRRESTVDEFFGFSNHPSNPPTILIDLVPWLGRFAQHVERFNWSIQGFNRWELQKMLLHHLKHRFQNWCVEFKVLYWGFHVVSFLWLSTGWVASHQETSTLPDSISDCRWIIPQSWNTIKGKWSHNCFGWRNFIGWPIPAWSSSLLGRSPFKPDASNFCHIHLTIPSYARATKWSALQDCARWTIPTCEPWPVSPLAAPAWITYSMTFGIVWKFSLLCFIDQSWIDWCNLFSCVHKIDPWSQREKGFTEIKSQHIPKLDQRCIPKQDSGTRPRFVLDLDVGLPLHTATGTTFACSN